jgi:hypothetical protein
VQPGGIDLKMIMFPAGHEIFDRMVGARRSTSPSFQPELSAHGARRRPFVALPVFPSRVFRHGYISSTRTPASAPRISKAGASYTRRLQSGCAGPLDKYGVKKKRHPVVRARWKAATAPACAAC